MKTCAIAIIAFLNVLRTCAGDRLRCYNCTTLGSNDEESAEWEMYAIMKRNVMCPSALETDRGLSCAEGEVCTVTKATQRRVEDRSVWIKIVSRFCSPEHYCAESEPVHEDYACDSCKENLCNNTASGRYLYLSWWLCLVIPNLAVLQK